MQTFEVRTIQQIPADQRHGRPADLATIWFGSNLNILTIATGALCTTVFGLSLGLATLAIVAGNLFGAIFMALHAAQGPHLGVPQMIQTRGQFGARGALAVIAVVAIMYVGFFASNLVLGAQSLHSTLPFVPVPAAILLVTILGLLATIFGHDLIHAYARLIGWLSGGALLVCFAWIFWTDPAAPAAFRGGSTHWSLVLGGFSTAVLWQVAYAPYVSDYSRYLPSATGARPAFWACYWGSVAGSVIPMILGALLGRLVPGVGVAESLSRVCGPLAYAVVPILTVSIAAASAISLYCAVLSSIAIVQTFARGWQAGAASRIAASILLSVAATILALLAGPHFMESYSNFILLLLYVLTPWTAINLIDYYLVRHGDYDVASFLRPDGGIYGLYNRPALLCYFVGIAVQLPFVSNGLHEGSIAHLLGGADVSWIVGLLVVSPLYYLLARRGPSPPQL